MLYEVLGQLSVGGHVHLVRDQHGARLVEPLQFHEDRANLLRQGHFTIYLHGVYSKSSC